MSKAAPVTPLDLPVPALGTTVPALLLHPPDARAVLVLAHGAGADMHHRFMAAIAAALAGAAICTYRYQFPYTAAGRRRPDPRPTLLATVRTAIEAARVAVPDLPLLAGGRSMGGRMTSLAMAETPIAEVRGLVFFGFPLHAAGRPSTERAGHLARVDRPMLFLQGERDRLADLALLRPICRDLGPRATLQVTEAADHGFHVPVRSGTTDAEVIVALARAVARWCEAIGAGAARAT